jgi:hypothetical protein
MWVNAFDEPDVAESKQNTRDLLSAWERQGTTSEGHPILEADGMIIYGDARQLEAWRRKRGSFGRGTGQTWKGR